VPGDRDSSPPTKVSTPPRSQQSQNFHASLQDNPSDDSQTTLKPDDDSYYESAGEESLTSTPSIANKKSQKNQETPDSKFILHSISPKDPQIQASAIKSPKNPIAAIPPSDLERHKLAGPIYASDLDNVVGKIFGAEKAAYRSDSEMYQVQSRRKSPKKKNRRSQARLLEAS
jgi:hypothetical protein